MPDPADPSSPVEEVFKAFESPSQYYAQVSDSIPHAQTARMSGLKNHTDADSSAPSTGAVGQQSTSPLLRKRTLSRSSMLSKTASHPDSQTQAVPPSDPHLSAHEMRALPGVLYEREKRRNSLRVNSMPANGNEDMMSSSMHFDSGFGRLSVRDRDDDTLGEEIERED